MINFTAFKKGERRLFIDFDLYTEGDKDFKQELISSMVKDLDELQQASKRSCQQNDPTAFHTAIHKVKATVTMLDDPELIHAIEDLRSAFSASIQSKALASFHNICSEVMTSLRKANC
ncbi:MAG TPA: hypothetical protein VD816_14790 [Ohtaekwangia sp.]|nr:hypothetical protein [Ohtaekwangia sp.]